MPKFLSYVAPVSCDDWEDSLENTKDGDSLEKGDTQE